jgi:hypothetical protein
MTTTAFFGVLVTGWSRLRRPAPLLVLYFISRFGFAVLPIVAVVAGVQARSLTRTAFGHGGVLLALALLAATALRSLSSVNTAPVWVRCR